MTPDELALVATLKARRNQARASGCVTVYLYCVYAICRITDSVWTQQRKAAKGG